MVITVMTREMSVELPERLGGTFARRISFSWSKIRSELGNGSAPIAVFAAGVAVVYLVSTIRYVWQTSYFYGDDFSTLYYLHTKLLHDVLLIPLGSQIVPFHRLLSWIVSVLAPMNFAATLAALGAFHLMALVYLYRTLQLVRHSLFNVVLTAAYATNTFFGFNLAWFSSGTTRFPYIAFSLLAIFHYVEYCRSGRRSHALAVAVSYVFALGFYSKAILIPVYCACFVLALGVTMKSGYSWRPRRGALILLAALLLCSALYVPAARHLIDDNVGRTNTDVAFLATFVRLAWVTLLNGAVGHPLDFLNYNPDRSLPFLVFAFVVYSIWRAPRSSLAWLMMVLVVSLNFLVVGISSRTLVFGHLMALEPRHLYEVHFLVVLFGAIVIYALRERAPEVAWLLTPPRTPVVHILFALVFAALAANAFEGFTSYEGRHHDQVRMSRRYMRTLQGDLGALRGSRAPKFVDGFAPTYLNPMDLEHRRVSDLFVAMDVKARFVPPAQAKYAVRDDGHVVHLR
jgi:hypothetical protein